MSIIAKNCVGGTISDKICVGDRNIGSIAGSKSMFKGWTDEDQEMFEKLTDPREKQQFINYIIKLKREGKRPRHRNIPRPAI